MELSVERLTKQYNNKIIVDKIDFKLNEGIYGFLGRKWSWKNNSYENDLRNIKSYIWRSKGGW